MGGRGQAERQGRHRGHGAGQQPVRGYAGAVQLEVRDMMHCFIDDGEVGWDMIKGSPRAGLHCLGIGIH